MTEDSRPLLAALWMTGAIVSFSTMAIAGRAAAVELDSFEVMMYRSFIGLAIVLAIGGATGKILKSGLTDCVSTWCVTSGTSQARISGSPPCH